MYFQCHYFLRQQMLSDNKYNTQFIYRKLVRECNFTDPSDARKINIQYQP